MDSSLGNGNQHAHSYRLSMSQSDMSWSSNGGPSSASVSTRETSPDLPSSGPSQHRSSPLVIQTDVIQTDASSLKSGAAAAVDIVTPPSCISASAITSTSNNRSRAASTATTTTRRGDSSSNTDSNMAFDRTASSGGLSHNLSSPTSTRSIHPWRAREVASWRASSGSYDNNNINNNASPSSATSSTTVSSFASMSLNTPPGPGSGGDRRITSPFSRFSVTPSTSYYSDMSSSFLHTPASNNAMKYYFQNQQQQQQQQQGGGGGGLDLVLPPALDPSQLHVLQLDSTNSNDNQADFRYYCFDRGDGKYTRLIPADMLPEMVDVPAYEPDSAGLVVLPIPPAMRGGENGGGGRSINSNSEKVAWKTPPSPATGGMSDHVQSHIDSIVASVPAPVMSAFSRRIKVYCDKWVHEGVCAFTQQGCRYKHEMPFDKATQHSLGLFHGLPAWWKKNQAELVRQTRELDDSCNQPITLPLSAAATNTTRLAHSGDHQRHQIQSPTSPAGAHPTTSHGNNDNNTTPAATDSAVSNNGNNNGGGNVNNGGNGNGNAPGGNVNSEQQQHHPLLRSWNPQASFNSGQFSSPYGPIGPPMGLNATQQHTRRAAAPSYPISPSGAATLNRYSMLGHLNQNNNSNSNSLDGDDDDDNDEQQHHQQQQQGARLS